MARRDAGFPFVLTFCRPWHVAATRDGGARQLFGVITDGEKKCNVTAWPQPGLPFPINPRRTLIVHLFAAEDQPAFERGVAEELGCCCLPLWRLPEVLPPASEEPPKLWLALEPPQSRKRAAASGGLAPGLEVREEAEFLERFERSRKLAGSNPQAPRICVFVQPLQEGPGTPGRVGSPLPSAGAAASRRQAAAGSRTGEQLPSPSPRPESSEEIWKAKFEEERYRYEEQRGQCQRDLRTARAVVEPVGKKLEAMSCFAADRLERCWLGASFDSWYTWVTDEKCRRQFEQLTDELEGLGRQRRAQASQAARSRAEAQARWREEDARLRRRAQRWAAHLAASEPLLAAGSSARALCGCWAAWRSWLSFSIAAHEIAQGRLEVLAWQQLAVVLIVWCGVVGQRTLEGLREAAREAKEQLPFRARHAAGERAAAASTGMYRASDEAFADAFRAWARTARWRGLRRSHAASVLDSPPWRGLDALFLECCLVLWRGSIGNAEATVAVERAAGHELVRLCRRRAGGLLEASREAGQVACAVAVVMCWHFFAAHCRLQRMLERAFAQHQDVKANCAQWSAELAQLRTGHGLESAKWQGDHDCLFEELRQVQRCHEEEARASEEGLESRQSLTMEEAASEQRSQTLANELADVLAHAQAAAGQLREAEAGAEAAELRAQEGRAACEEECEAARLGVQPLQQEVARQLEKRQGDVRAARQQARAQASRQETAARRLVQQLAGEQDSLAQKLEQSESRVGRLEQEVQQARQSRRATRTPEPEGEELLLEVTAAEQRLEAFEEGERRRAQELAGLRRAQADLQAQHAALERRRAAGLRA